MNELPESRPNPSHYKTLIGIFPCHLCDKHPFPWTFLGLCSTYFTLRWFLVRAKWSHAA